MKPLDLIGKHYGDLTVISQAPKPPGRSNTFWNCICRCGNEKVVVGANLQSGNTKSCGCARVSHFTEGMKSGRLTVLRKTDGRAKDGCIIWLCKCDCGNEVGISAGELKQKKSCGCIFSRHRMHGSRTYNSYREMKKRCLNPTNHKYPLYGGRGIKVCDRWLMSFPAFLSDMGECPDGCTLDRWPDKNGNYEPGNCRWATPRQQAQNMRSNTLLTLNGTTLCVSEWGRVLNISPYTIRTRLRKGWSHEKALSPVRKKPRARNA